MTSCMTTKKHALLVLSSFSVEREKDVGWREGRKGDGEGEGRGISEKRTPGGGQ